MCPSSHTDHVVINFSYSQRLTVSHITKNQGDKEKETEIILKQVLNWIPPACAEYTSTHTHTPHTHKYTESRVYQNFSSNNGNRRKFNNHLEVSSHKPTSTEQVFSSSDV